MLLSKCAVCDRKKFKFIKKQEARRLVSSFGIKTPLRKIPLVGLPLFSEQKKFLLAGDKFMPEMHLRHIVLVDNLQKTKKEYKSLKKQEIHNIFIKSLFSK